MLKIHHQVICTILIVQQVIEPLLQTFDLILQLTAHPPDLGHFKSVK
jgi:hypothetical protein